MLPGDLELISRPEAQKLLDRLANLTASNAAIEANKLSRLPARIFGEQVDCRHRAAKKLPSWVASGCLFDKPALEQASSEATAACKALLMAGERFFDMTLGLGVDAAAFSRRGGRVTACEIDPVRVELFEHNREKLELSGVELIEGDGLSRLEVSPFGAFDWVYADPSRRSGNRRHSVDFSCYRPDLSRCIEECGRKAPNWCIKLSPAVEPSELVTRFAPSAQLVAIQWRNEVKELLLMHRKERQTEPRAVALVVDDKGTVRHRVEGTPARSQTEAAPVEQVGEWLFDPAPAVRRLRLSDVVARDYHLRPLGAVIDLLTGNQKCPGFPGDQFQVETVLPWKPREIRRYFRSAGISRARVVRRDFPLAPDSFKKRFGLGEAGEPVLFCTRVAGHHLCMVTRPVVQVSDTGG